jgi:hypothetical protein
LPSEVLGLKNTEALLTDLAFLDEVAEQTTPKGKLNQLLDRPDYKEYIKRRGGIADG